MPKFIWVAEIYENDNFNTGKADGLIVIDATEANNSFWIHCYLLAILIKYL